MIRMSEQELNSELHRHSEEAAVHTSKSTDTVIV